MKMENITMQELLDIADFMYLALDIDQKVVLINRKGCEILGYPENEILGKNWFDNFLPKRIVKETKKSFIQRIKVKKESKTRSVNEILTKQGEEKIIGWQNNYLRDEEGNISGVLSAGMDITEETTIRRELEERDRLFKSIIENSPNGFVAFKGDDNIVITNPALEEMVGYTHEELKEITLIGITHPEDIELTNELYAKTKSKELTSAVYEKRYIRKDGSLVDAKVISWGTFDNEGNLLYNFGTIENITDQKRTQIALKESEKRFINIFDSSPFGMHLYELKDDGNLIFIGYNKTASEILGIDNNIFLGKSIEEAFPDLSETEVPERYRIAAKEGISWSTDQVDYEEGGIKGAFEVQAFQTSPDVMIAAFQDITERKQMQEQIIKERDFSKKLLNIAGVMFVLVNKDEEIELVNKRATEILGYTKEELIGKNWFEVTYPKDEWDERKKSFSDVISGETEVIDYSEREILTKKGEKKIIALRNVEIKDKNGNISHMLGSGQDITEQKKTEEELRISENLYRTIFEVSGAALAISDENGIHQLVNPKCEELYGYSKEEMENKKNWREFMHKDELERVSEISNRRRIEPDSVPSQYETRVVDSHGNVKDVIVDVKLIPESKNSIASLVDITEMKKTERALIESETKFRSIFNNSHDGYILRTTDGVILEINPRILDIFGYTEEDVVTGNVTEFQPYESQEELLNIMREVETKGYAHYETNAKKKDGTLFPIEVKSFKFYIDKEEVILGIIRDISQRKEAERILIESEAKLRNLVDNIPLAISTMSKAGEIIDINPAQWKLFGYKTRELFNQANTSDHWINMKDREKMYALLKKKNDVKDYNIKLRKRDGSVFWGSVSAISHKDVSGEIIYYQILQDITTQKEMEDELRSQIMKYKLEEANLYVVEEVIAHTSVEIFNELLKVGYEGIIFSRIPEDTWREDIKNNFGFQRISEKGTGKAIPPSLEKIENVIEELSNKQVILIDRLDYLIQKNGFENTLFFIYRLIDIAYLANHIILLSIDSSTLREREKSLLLKELKFVETKIEGIIPEDLYEVLVYIYQQNMIGDKPTVSDIMQELHISRPTARKRIQALIDQGYMVETVKGRSKVHQITQKGRIIF